MATPAAILSILVKTQGAQAAAGQLGAVDAAARKAGNGVGTLEKANKRGSDAFAKVGKAAGIIALGVGVIGGAAVNAAAKYESSMNTLKAVSGSSGAEMAKLSKLAIKLGADVRLPGTSAQDAAEAMTEMIKAGVSLKDTMAGVRDVLVLSAAAGVSNAEAAEIASNALNAFKLQGKDVKMVTDQLANTANASSVEIRDVADSMKMAAAVFSGFQAPTLGAKGALTQLNVAIGLLGNAGIKGSDAGTSLKQTLLQLTGPSDKAKGAMQALYFAAKGNAGAEGELTGAIKGTAKERAAALAGLAKLNPALKGGGDIAYDSAGKMRSLKDVIALTAAGTKNMTAEQKNAYLTMIFGADATRSVIALMNAGPAAWDKMTAAVTKQGAAQALADAKMKGFKGSLEALKSTLETLAINVGTKLLPVLTMLAQQLSAVVSLLTPTAWLVLIGVIGTLATAVFAVSAAMKVYTAGQIVATAVTWALATSVGAVVLPIAAVAAGLAILGIALVVAYKKFETFRNIVNAVFGWLKSNWPQVLGILTGPIGRAAGIIIQHWGRIKSTFTSALAALKTAMSSAAGGLASAAGAMARMMVGAFKAALNFAHELAVAMRDLIVKAPGYALGVGRAVVRGIINGIKSAAGWLGNAIGDVVKGAASKLPDLNPFGDVTATTRGRIPGGGGGATGGLAPAARSGLSFINRTFGGVRVSSGFRTPEENRRVGGATNSDHLTGNALDLVPAGGWTAGGTALLDRIAAWAKNSPAIRWIGWRGTPGHGPGDHLHLSFLPGGAATGAVGKRGIGDVTGRTRGRMAGAEWGRAAGAVKNASPKPGQGGGQAAVIAAAAKRHGIDPAILWGLFGAESNFGKNLGPSSAGARGPFQFMPQTAKAYGIDPMDFKAAANAAAKYLATYKERGTAGMLLAYNAGPAGKMNPESAAYIPKVKKLAKTWPGAKGTSKTGSTTSSTAAERVNPLDQKLANADVAIEQAKRGTIKVGNRKISSALQQVAALTGKRQVIGKRIRSIRKALKGKLSGAKRLALTQELSQRLGEHAQLGTDVKALRNPAADATTDLGAGAAGDLGGGGDPNQALIDSNAALQETINAQIAADKEHTDALNAVKAEVKRQTDFATSVANTSNFQLTKGLADMLSGQIVGYGVAGRRFTPGSGVEFSY